MSHYTLKRRRPHDPDVPSPELALQDLGSSSSTGFGVSPLSASDRGYHISRPSPTVVNVTITVPLFRLLNLDRRENQDFVLAQTASALNVPFTALISSTQSSGHRHKRPRRSPDMPLSSLFPGSSARPAGDEKLLFSSQTSAEHGPPSWASAGLNCLANLTSCPPYSSYDAESLHGRVPPSSFDYSDVVPYASNAAGTMPAEAMSSYNDPSATAERTAFLSPETSSMMALPYLDQYPPLQPTRVLAVQPHANRDGMVYPISALDGKYPATSPVEASFETTASHSGAVLHGSLQDGHVSAAFGRELPPPLQQGETLMTLPPRLDVPSHYGLADLYDGISPILQPAPDTEFPIARTSTISRRGPFKNQDMREKTAQTRKIGSCIRCRMQRIRCNLDVNNEKGNCMNCIKMAASPGRSWRLPCLRLKITDVKLFKPGQVQGHEWTRRWQDTVVDDIDSWVSTETKTIRVTEGYTGKDVRLRVREFVPQPGDKLERSWVSKGRHKSVRIPPYAIVDMEAAKDAFGGYIKDGLEECCKTLLGPREKLLWRTYAVALRLAKSSATPSKERELLVKTFDLWMSIRLTTKSFEIVGDETLGMPHDLIQDRDNPLCGKIPLPPVMGAQIDSVLIHQVQADLRRETLELLQNMTQEKKPRTWLTTYLVSFILLHNIALITSHDAEYAKKHGMTRRFAREDKVKEYNIGASTLLAYFHYCNKGVFPFSEDCRDQDLSGLAELDDSTIEYVATTRRYAADHKRQWEDLWQSDDYENEYYYVSQLYEQNWQPRNMA